MTQASIDQRSGKHTVTRGFHYLSDTDTGSDSWHCTHRHASPAGQTVKCRTVKDITYIHSQGLNWGKGGDPTGSPLPHLQFEIPSLMLDPPPALIILDPHHFQQFIMKPIWRSFSFQSHSHCDIIFYNIHTSI